MNRKPFDWIFACLILVALAAGFVMGCVTFGVLLALGSLFGA